MDLVQKFLDTADARARRHVRRQTAASAVLHQLHGSGGASVIALRVCTKRFGHVEAVRDVTFTASDGTVTGLLGQTAPEDHDAADAVGSDAPDSGSILVDGADVVADPIGAQRFMGLLPDARGLYPRLTPREHIQYWLAAWPLAGCLARAHGDLVRRLGLESIADRRVAGFSQGERTKVALARLVHGPRNVILDEPTNGLDVMMPVLRGLIRGLREEGCCVVFRVTSCRRCRHCAIASSSSPRAPSSLMAPDALRKQTGGRSRKCVCGTRRTRNRGGRMSRMLRLIWAVFRKELLDGSRDRRSISSLVFSGMITPLLFGIMFTVAAERRKSADGSRCRSKGCVRTGADRLAHATEWRHDRAGTC